MFYYVEILTFSCDILYKIIINFRKFIIANDYIRQQIELTL